MRSTKSLVWRNLTAHPLRSTLTALAITLGVAMVLATAVIGQAANQQITTLEAGAAAQSDSTLSTLMLQVGLVMVGLIILFAAAFVIMNAFAMSITARAHEIGSLRALGMTRHQILNQVMGEAGMLGLIGAGVGIPVGVGLAWLVMVLRDTVPDGGLIVPWWGIVLSLVLGLVTTQLGALQPAYRASKLSPLMAMQSRAQTTENPSRTPKIGIALFFGLLIGLPAVAFIWQANYIESNILLAVGILGLLTAVLLILPLLIAPMTEWTRPFLTRYFGTSGRLAADNITRNTRRTARTAAALTIGLTMIIATSTLLTASLKGGLEGFLSLSNENAMVIHDISALLASGEMTLENSMEIDKSMKPIDPVVLAAIVESGVAEQVIRYGFAAIPSEIATFPGTPGGFIEPQKFFSLGNFDFFEGDPDTALAMMQKGNALLLIPMTAARLGVSVGDTIPVATLHGDVDFVVAGIGGTTSNFTLFSYTDGERYFNLTDPAWLGIVAKEGETDGVIAELESIIVPFGDLIVFDMRDSRAGGLTEIVDQMRSLLNAMLLLAVVVAALGIVNTMVINVSERGREIGLLRAVGATRRQVRQSVMVEAAVIGLMAAFIAAGLALLLLGMYSLIFLPNGSASVGLRMNRDVFMNMMLPALKDWGITAVFALILGPLIAALAAYYPARQAAAVNIVEATRSERLSLSGGGDGRKESHHPRRSGQFLSLSLAWRNLQEYQWRAIFSAFAVALGVAMIVAAEVTSSGIIDSIGNDDDGILIWMIDMMDVVLSIIGIVVLAAAGFLIFNAFGMTVAQRRKQIGLLRALGMTRKQVLRQIQTEALMIGAAGTVLGLALGPLFGNLILAAFRQVGVEMGTGSASVGSLVLGVVMGLGITLLSVWIPARQAARVSPLTTLREVSSQQLATRHSSLATLIGIVILIILWGYLAIAPPGAWSGNHPPMELILFPVLLVPWFLAIGLLLPALIGGAGRLLKWLTGRIGGANGRFINGRLIADNLTRNRRRITLTVLTFAVGLTMISGLNGLLTFSNDVLLVQSAAGSLAQTTWYVYPFDRSSGLAQINEMDSGNGLAPAVIEDIVDLADGRAIVAQNYIVIIPEISALMPNFLSMINDVRELNRPGVFEFVEGDWKTAVPIMESGCGLLLPPAVANQREVGVGDTLILPGKDGDVVCIVAGVGSGGNLPISRISMAAKDQFDVGNPAALAIWPLPETDEAAFRAELDALDAQHGDNAWITDTEEELQSVLDTSDQLEKMTYAMLVLAIVAAALGMVNTTVMSVTERRHELGLLRAVGMTRRQVTTMVVGEAAMIGVLGGLVGLIAGTGFTLIFGLSFGGIPFGLLDLPLWEAAWEAGREAIKAGMVGMILAPLIAAFAAYWPSRSVLHGSAIETMEGRSHPNRQKGAGLFSRGSIRTRFMAGTAVLMLLVLVGLTAVVTLHARNYLEEVTTDSVAAMVEFNASLIEFNLPPDADALTLDMLQSGSMDAEMMLEFRSLIDEMNAYGLSEFVIANQDDVVLFGFDMGQIGTALEPLSDGEKTITAVSETDDGQRQIEASAPIRNANGDLLGSSRLRMGLGEVSDFLRDLSGAILMVGGLILALGLALAWWATTPLVRTTRQLAAGAEHAGQGQFYKITLRKRWNVSLKVKLTTVMVIILILLVGLLEQVILPIERQKVEEVTQNTLVVATEWMAQLFSSGLAEQSINLSEIGSLADMLQLAQATNIGNVQELSDQMPNVAIAYMALINENGVVQLADQFDMIGSDIPIPTQTLLEETTWQDDPIWRITTPLHDEDNNAIIGGLQIGMFSAQVDAFLDESRTLFRLTGIIAILAGVLLAQVIGGAIVAPVQRLAADSRRVADGDLSVQFKTSSRLTNSRDELSQLAGAFNEMVTGLQEREWLRDMFGRFVSQEVAEAIRTGQVKLEGENRVVSVLFCDIRGFTSRSEKSTPAEIVALLNEYLPVVVNAAQKHNGTVNKFGGDSTLIIYGAPKNLQESAYHAVLTALEMRRSLSLLNQRLAARGEEPIRIGVGINTGMVLAGAVGPPERQEYTVIGDTVNLASRIEALNKVYPQHGILISGQTYEALNGRQAEFTFTDLGEIKIRGKSAAVRVWAVGA